MLFGIRFTSVRGWIQMYDRFVDMYHSSVRRKLRDVIEGDLTKPEIVQLLSWINEYTSVVTEQ